MIAYFTIFGKIVLFLLGTAFGLSLLVFALALIILIIFLGIKIISLGIKIIYHLAGKQEPKWLVTLSDLLENC